MAFGTPENRKSCASHQRLTVELVLLRGPLFPEFHPAMHRLHRLQLNGHWSSSGDVDALAVGGSRPRISDALFAMLCFGDTLFLSCKHRVLSVMGGAVEGILS